MTKASTLSHLSLVVYLGVSSTMANGGGIHEAFFLHCGNALSLNHSLLPFMDIFSLRTIHLNGFGVRGNNGWRMQIYATSKSGAPIVNLPEPLIYMDVTTTGSQGFASLWEAQDLHVAATDGNNLYYTRINHRKKAGPVMTVALPEGTDATRLQLWIEKVDRKLMPLAYVFGAKSLLAVDLTSGKILNTEFFEMSAVSGMFSEALLVEGSDWKKRNAYPTLVRGTLDGLELWQLKRDEFRLLHKLRLGVRPNTLNAATVWVMDEGYRLTREDPIAVVGTNNSVISFAIGHGVFQKLYRIRTAQIKDLQINHELYEDPFNRKGLRSVMELETEGGLFKYEIDNGRFKPTI